MDVSDPDETLPANKDRSSEVEKEAQEATSSVTTASSGDNSDYDSILDISGGSLDFPVSNGAEESMMIKGLYVYKNVFNLLPRWLGSQEGLKTLKFFANEVSIFPAEFGKSVDQLECLQVKISSLGLTGLPLHKLKGLKELELCNLPPRPSAFPLLSEIACLRCLTKLAVCHFSIRFLPPEIGCLKNLECLDVSFNKLRSLPTEISNLSVLISLKVSNNKLVKLPSSLSVLQKLENLELSNNRLTSLGCVELGSMHNLQKLNLENNKLLSCCQIQIPSWISCNFEGNGKDSSNDEEFTHSSVEMDVVEGATQEIYDSPRNRSHSASSRCSSNSRSFASKRRRKGWKRRYYLQERVHQQHLNSNKKWKGEDSSEILTQKTLEKCKSGKHPVGADIDNKDLFPGEDAGGNLLISVEDDEISLKKEYDVENCSSCVTFDSVEVCKDRKNDCMGHEASSLKSGLNSADVQGEGSSSELSNCNNPKSSKRHPDRDFDNPKPSKYRKPTDDDHSADLSCKYSNTSFCSIEDHLPDGFYDAGRDRPFMPLEFYDQNLHMDSSSSREVILVDRKRDEDLDAIALCAQAFIFHFKQINGCYIDHFQIASLLALFVSDHFGGSDKSATIEKTRKAVSGSNYRKPFVCTCTTGNSNSIRKSSKAAEDIVFFELCEKSLECIKTRRNSMVVPIGTLQFGVCRHRALLLKYLCDRMEPRVPCELVRGYLDFSPHAWNIVVIKKGDSLVRMIVDACRPHDIREETDPEYLCRYIPLGRINVPLTGPSCYFPSNSLSACDKIGRTASSTLFRCNIGSVEAAMKLHTLEVCGTTSVDEIKKFEYRCLGEVRILNALKKHSCIVEIYGHQISSKWDDGKPAEHRILQSAILMEYIKGGSLKNYIEKLSRAGEKHLPPGLALCIARDVAFALSELHSKHIIHRDIKSDNILIDLERKRADGCSPVVKLCDFDMAVPLHSSLHTCCIAHTGIPPPDVCVGTPPWMAPEVFQAMDKRNKYGLEVDIWSFGCLLLELLTLQIPYSGLPESNIHHHLRTGKRPQLTDELEALGSLEEPAAMAQSDTQLKAGPEAEPDDTLRFLVDMFRQCTEGNPTDRPTAENLYNMLVARTSSFTSSTSLEQEEVVL